MKADYSKKNLEKIVKESWSLAEIAKKLGLKPKGSNNKTIKKYIDKYKLDTSHFTGQQWNKGKSTPTNKIEDLLKENVNYSSNRLLNRLVKEGLKDYKCERCGISEWKGKPITLELHHKDGNHYNNTFDNLEVLCPNCHSQTETYRNRNKSKTKKPERITKLKNPEKVCPICGKTFKGSKSTTKYCSLQCYRKALKINK